MNTEEVCCGCGTTKNLTAIFDKEDDATDEYVCELCFKQNDDKYVRCRFCERGDENKVYYSDSLNEKGECSNHRGESYMSPEDAAGWDSNIRRWDEEE